jgi:hypothetical protein
VSFINRFLIQDLTYWPPATEGATNDFGHPILQDPVLIKGRWEAKTQQIRRSNGEEVVSSAQVWTDQDVEPSGYLAQGDLTDQPEPPEEAYEIQDFQKSPDLRNLDHERKAFL